jgi:hypothetical protein
MGNVLFSFIYKHDNIHFDNYEAINDYYFQEFIAVEKSITFKPNPQLQLIYYDLPNVTFHFKKADNVSFTSMRDIKDVELCEELKGDNITLSRLLELLDIACKKYDFFTILQKIHNFICKKEFTNERLQIFKEKLTIIFENIIDVVDLHDNVIIPFIFDIFRIIFFKGNEKQKKKKNSNMEVEQKYQDVYMYKIEKYPTYAYCL